MTLCLSGTSRNMEADASAGGFFFIEKKASLKFGWTQKKLLQNKTVKDTTKTGNGQDTDIETREMGG